MLGSATLLSLFHAAETGLVSPRSAARTASRLAEDEETCVRPAFHTIHVQNHPLHHSGPRSISEDQGGGAKELLSAGGGTRGPRGAGVAPTIPSTFLLLPRLAIPTGTACCPPWSPLPAALSMGEEVHAEKQQQGREPGSSKKHRNR